MLDISEVEPANLLTKLDGKFDSDATFFKFTEQDGVLLKALQENKTVILKGHFQEELCYQLSEFLLQRQQAPNPLGRLLLVSEQANVFPMIPSYHHQVTVEEKREILFPRWDPSDSLVEKYSLTELIAMGNYYQMNLEHPVNAGDAWQGMERLPPLAARAIDFSVFNEHRRQVVKAALEQSPFVFLAGMTGVGKTSFVQDVWKKETSSLYIGEESCLAWAHDLTFGLKTLFIDEANISSRQWSQFEGLFHNPPSILMDNEVIKLSPQHKVIFAGNPVSYGGERRLPTLFKRHGSSVIFEPMPSAYIEHEILMPIFSEMNTNDAHTLSEPILAVSEFLTACSFDSVLISPRELAMMALLTVIYCREHPQINGLIVARYYAYTLAKGFVPETNQSAFAEKFKMDDLPRLFLDDSPLANMKNVVVNASNRPAFNAISDFLELRRSRQHQLFNNDIQLYGGLGGLILEGDPGIGKTMLVKEALVAHGFSQGSKGNDSPHENVFYSMPASMPRLEKEKLLLKAFHEGAVVIVDEINSAPMMERLLNDLLMGKTPQGDRPNKPGFMIIGTQNPMTMAGRTPTGRALQHRMQKIQMPEYTRDEMVTILIHKGLQQLISQNMVDEYCQLREQSSQHPNSSVPTLCFRDLLKRAEQEITALKRMRLPLAEHLQVLGKSETESCSQRTGDFAQFFPPAPEASDEPFKDSNDQLNPSFQPGPKVY